MTDSVLILDCAYPPATVQSAAAALGDAPAQLRAAASGSAALAGIQLPATADGFAGYLPAGFPVNAWTPGDFIRCHLAPSRMLSAIVAGPTRPAGEPDALGTSLARHAWTDLVGEFDPCGIGWTWLDVEQALMQTAGLDYCVAFASAFLAQFRTYAQHPAREHPVGVYGPAAVLARLAVEPAIRRPGAPWIADWNTAMTLEDLPGIDPASWAGHRLWQLLPDVALAGRVTADLSIGSPWIEDPHKEIPVGSVTPIQLTPVEGTPPTVPASTWPTFGTAAAGDVAVAAAPSHEVVEARVLASPAGDPTAVPAPPGATTPASLAAFAGVPSATPSYAPTLGGTSGPATSTTPQVAEIPAAGPGGNRPVYGATVDVGEGDVLVLTAGPATSVIVVDPSGSPHVVEALPEAQGYQFARPGGVTLMAFPHPVRFRVTPSAG